MPLKFRSLLQKKQDKFNLDVVEFTYAMNPNKSISLITIVHPLDTFCRKTGYKIIKDRIKWAENETEAGRSINHKPWAYILER